MVAAETKVEPKVEPKDGKTVLTKTEPTGAPEKYEAFTVPEGFTLDEATNTEAVAVFKELNLDQTQAQKLVDFHTAKLKAATDAPVNAYRELREKWQGEAKSDPTIGHRLPEIKVNYSRALDAIGDPKLAADFRAALDTTGAGDNPAVIKVIDAWSKRLTEGKSVTGGVAPVTAPNAKPKSAASAMYPNLP